MSDTESMKVRCAHDDLVPLKKLTPHPKNRNKHPKEQIERLAKILRYQGWRYCVKVSRQSSFVTAGHGRIEAAKLNHKKYPSEGWDKAPVNYQDYDSDEQEYADVQADNAIASWAELDLSGINTDLADLGPDFELDLLAIKGFSLDLPDFEAGTEDDQGLLDQKKFEFRECPHCNERFEIGQARKLKD